jgi:hypothetical protein
MPTPADSRVGWEADIRTGALAYVVDGGSTIAIGVVVAASRWAAFLQNGRRIPSRQVM